MGVKAKTKRKGEKSKYRDMGKIGGFFKALSPHLPIVGGIAEGIINSRTAKRNTDMTIKANKEMAEYQYSKDLEMWNRGNVYNAPEAQMERLKAAGLNPNMVYGGGAAGAAGTSGQLPKYNAPTLNYNYEAPVHPGQLLGMYQDFQIRQAQANNLVEQNKILKHEAEIKKYEEQFRADTLIPRSEMEWEKYYPMKATKQAQLETIQQNLKQKKELFPTQLQYQQGQIKQQEAAIQKMEADTELTNKQNEWYLTKMFSQLGLQAAGKIADFMPTGKAAKVIGGAINQKGRNSKAPWATTLKVNPRRRASAGAYNP